MTSAKNTKAPMPAANVSLEHYLRILLHRWWIVSGTFVAATALTVFVVWRLPDIYTSTTVILVDPQRIPESYIKPTVTGDVRSRLGTLEQQILSATRLQTIIDSLKLYQEERKSMFREEILAKMRKDIDVALVGGGQGPNAELQAFKITYSGKEPRLVARVANELAAQFIEENLKAREQQATGTTEFLENQLQASRKELETQEGKLRDFRLKHLGEMPEQQNSTLQILGNLQSQLQLEGEAVSRAEQQRELIMAMISQSGAAPVVDLDDGEVKGVTAYRDEKVPAAPGVPKPPVAVSTKAKLQAELADHLKRGHTENHPDVKKLRQQIAEEEAKEAATRAATPAPAPPKPPAPKETVAAVNEPEVPAPPAAKRGLVSTPNPVLQSQLKSIDAEIAKHKQEQQRISKLVTAYQSKLEAIPVREQEIADLARNYDISKGHYNQLLDRELSAETATQLEIRQKSEKFTILDPAQPSEKPAKPNRPLLDGAGAAVGLVLGLVLALVTEVFGMSITTPEQIISTSGIPVLEAIPVIRTAADRRRFKMRLILASASGVVMMLLGVIVLMRYRGVI
jgi:polysaccharide chain length determinant protein (PEP-CTERM system associated)